MTESEIQASIRKALGREHDLALFRYSPGKTKDKRTGKEYRAGLSIAGGSDLVGILSVGAWVRAPGHDGAPVTVIERMMIGRWFVLEIKTPEHLARILRAIARGNISGLSKSDRDQIAFIKLVRSKGGFGAHVDSVEAARAAVERARSGAYE